MHKLAKAICKHRKLILIISLLLVIPSIIVMKATRINYDILVYLPDDVETIQGEKILSEDFDMGGFSVIILENMKNKDILKLENKIKEILEDEACFFKMSKEAAFSVLFYSGVNTDKLEEIAS